MATEIVCADMRAGGRPDVGTVSFMHSPSFAYSSTVFFSPTLNPSVVEGWRSSSAWLAMFVKTGGVKLR